MMSYPSPDSTFAVAWDDGFFGRSSDTHKLPAYAFAAWCVA